jgi:shikimate kinase
MQYYKLWNPRLNLALQDSVTPLERGLETPKHMKDLTGVSMFQNKPNISLIGFMGSGKTTIGRLIAKIEDLKFCDTDALIVEKSDGKSITDIFNDFGEKYFRGLEADAIKSLKDVKSSVISCGGGVVLNEDNMRLLREISVVVYLHANSEKIYSNLKKSDSVRPLLLVDDVMAEIDSLLKVRKPLYMKYCHIAVDVTDFGVKESAYSVLRLLGCVDTP